MKIVYLANVRMPTEKAHGYQIICTAATFAQMGATVELWVPRRHNPILEGVAPLTYYGVERPQKDKFKIEYLHCQDYIRGRMSHFIGPLAFWWQTWTFANSVKRRLRIARPDLVYSRDELLLKQLLRSLPQGVKLVVELHAMPSSRYQGLLKKVDRIIVITNAIKHGLIGRGITAEKIKVVSDAADPTQFSQLPDRTVARHELGLPVDGKIALYTGHPYPWKGVFTLAQASALLPEDWYVVLVGGLPTDLEPLQKFIAENKLDRVTVIPHQERNKLPRYHAAADVLVIPNSAKTDRSRLYTSPLKLFEYLASGRPIVASGLPSIQEIVDNHIVIFVKPDDPVDLAQGISTVLDQPQAVRVTDRQRLVEYYYSWKNRGRKIIEFLPWD